MVIENAQVAPNRSFTVTSSAVAHLIRMHSLAPSFLPAPEPLRPQTELTDLETVNAVIGGQREMFEVIVRRYNTQLYRVGMAYLRNHAMTEDAMQNAYLKGFLNLHRFRGTAAFSTWLTRIMIN